MYVSQRLFVQHKNPWTAQRVESKSFESTRILGKHKVPSCRKWKIEKMEPVAHWNHSKAEHTQSFTHASMTTGTRQTKMVIAD